MASIRSQSRAFATVSRMKSRIRDKALGEESYREVGDTVILCIKAPSGPLFKDGRDGRTVSAAAAVKMLAEALDRKES